MVVMLLFLLHARNQLFRRARDQRGYIDLCGGQYIHRRSGELRRGLFVEQLTELRDLFLGQFAVLVRGLHTVHDRLFQLADRDLRELDQFLLRAVHGIELG